MICKLTHLPMYEKTVRHWGVFRVPRHIVRVDKEPDDGRGATHGWQVRYRQPTKFFSDTTRWQRGTPKSSLLAAKRYLAGIYRGPRGSNNIQMVESKRKLIQLGIPGIRLFWRQQTARSVCEWYLLASSPTRSAASKKIYLGTDTTVSEARFDRALRRAKILRQQMLDTHLATKQEVVR